jgi:hypothetical protein
MKRAFNLSTYPASILNTYLDSDNTTRQKQNGLLKHTNNYIRFGNNRARVSTKIKRISFL